MQKEQKETWRELVRENREPSWRERRDMWGMGIGSISGIFLSMHQLFRGNSFITGETSLSPLWLFLIGIDAAAISVSTYLIYYRNLTDKGLFRAGVALRLGETLFGPIVLLLTCPWHSVAEGKMKLVECAVICVALIVISLGVGGVSLCRLIRRYRPGEQIEKRQKDEEKARRRALRESNKDPWD